MHPLDEAPRPATADAPDSVTPTPAIRGRALAALERCIVAVESIAGDPTASTPDRLRAIDQLAWLALGDVPHGPKPHGHKPKKHPKHGPRGDERIGPRQDGARPRAHA
jgi:hypothetical protein